MFLAFTYNNFINIRIKVFLYNEYYKYIQSLCIQVELDKKK